MGDESLHVRQAIADKPAQPDERDRFIATAQPVLLQSLAGASGQVGNLFIGKQGIGE
jgi:hypothetical protein